GFALLLMGRSSARLAVDVTALGPGDRVVDCGGEVHPPACWLETKIAVYGGLWPRLPTRLRMPAAARAAAGLRRVQYRHSRLGNPERHPDPGCVATDRRDSVDPMAGTARRLAARSARRLPAWTTDTPRHRVALDPDALLGAGGETGFRGRCHQRHLRLQR